MILNDSGSWREAQRRPHVLKHIRRRGKPICVLLVAADGCDAFDAVQGGWVGWFRSEAQAREALRLPLSDAA